MERLPPPFHGLWAEKPITAVMVLLPQDGVNTVYLVIRMLFLAFLFPWPSLFSVSPAAVLLGQLAPGAARECRAGNSSIPCLPPAEPCCVLPKLKVKALGCTGR